MSRSKEQVNIHDVDAVTITYLYVRALLGMLGLFLVLCIFWGDYALFSINELWSRSSSPFEGLGKVWFIFVWVVAVTLLAGIITSRTAPLYGVWVDMKELEAEGDGIPGDIVAEEMMVTLREINAKRKRIASKDVGAPAG